MELDEELVYQYVEDGSLTVQESNTFCTGVRLKIHSQLADYSLVLTQKQFTITRERFLEDKDGIISAEFKRITLPRSVIYISMHVKLITQHTCLKNNTKDIYSRWYKESQLNTMKRG